MPGYRLLNPSLIFFLIKPLVTREKVNGPSSIYEVVIPHLKCLSSESTVSPDDVHGPFQTPQRAGTCYFRSINATVKFISHKIFKLERGVVKRLMLSLRCSYLDCAIEQLNGINSAANPSGPNLEKPKDLSAFPLLDGDAFMIKLGAQLTVRAAGKAILRSHIDQTSLSIVEQRVQNLLEALSAAAVRLGTPSASSGGGAPLPPLLRWTAGDLTLPGAAKATLWPRFDLLANLGRKDVEAFVGITTSSPAELFTNLLPYEPKSFRWRFADVEAALVLANKQVT